VTLGVWFEVSIPTYLSPRKRPEILAALNDSVKIEFIIIKGAEIIQLLKCVEIFKYNEHRSEYKC
jgi:hypothetical protein